MSYILTTDLKRLIQTDNLSQIVGADATITDVMIETAETEIKTYLVQKYLIADEFRDWKLYTNPGTFYAGDRILLDAPAYASGTLYTPGQMSLYLSNVYRAINSTTGPFAAGDWALIGAQYTKYYALLPTDTTYFNYLLPYAVGAKVYYLGKTYTAVQASGGVSTAQALQYRVYSNLPYINVFPNAPDYGVAYWGVGVALSYVDQNIYNTAKYTTGDTRNQELVNYCIDIALYHLHSRIAPRNIPDLRIKRYEDAIRKLMNYAKGDDVTLDLPRVQPNSGSRIRFDSNVKQINSY